MKDLIFKEAAKFGATDELMERLWYSGSKLLRAWFCQRLCDSTEEGTLYQRLEYFAQMCNITKTQAEYCYYSTPVTPLNVLSKREDYEYVRAVIEDSYSIPKFWDSVLPYAYRIARNLSIELMIEDGVEASEIINRLNMSRSHVYNIRREYLDTYIAKKGLCQ